MTLILTGSFSSKMPNLPNAGMEDKLRKTYQKWPRTTPSSSDVSSSTLSLRPKDPREFVCGWGSASINVVMTFPMNKVIFRQQLYGIRTHVAVRQLQKEGLVHLYRGLMPPFLQKTTSMSLMFGMYDAIQRMLHYAVPSLPIYVNKSTAAILAGCTEATLAPFERVQTLMQDIHKRNHWKNTLHAFRDIHSQHGVLEFYRGLGPILVRNGLSNAMFFLGREDIKKMLPPATTSGGDVFLNFVSGAVLGAFISTIFFPVNVVKTQMQSKVGGDFVGFKETFNVVFQERNRSWKKIFYGAHWNFSRSLISWGVINASYELLKQGLYPNHTDH